MWAVNEMGGAELGAVVIVMEGYEQDELLAEWSADDRVRYPVTELDDGLYACGDLN